MSQPFLPTLKQQLVLTEHPHPHHPSEDLINLLSLQQSNIVPSPVFVSTSSSHPVAIELAFEPIHLFRFCALLLIFLLIPILSVGGPLSSLASHRRLHASRHSARRSSRLVKIRLPADYEPPQSTVDAPFIPLPTRRHFRIAHAGNRNPGTAKNLVYTNHSSSDSEDSQSDRGHDGSDQDSLKRFRLVFGKRLRGEEEEFKGRSAMKGSRSLASRSMSSSSSTIALNDSQLPSYKASEAHPNIQTTTITKKVISFAATQARPHPFNPNRF